MPEKKRCVFQSLLMLVFVGDINCKFSGEDDNNQHPWVNEYD